MAHVWGDQFIKFYGRNPFQVEQFFNDVPEFERMLVRSGIRLILVLGHGRRAADAPSRAHPRPAETMEALTDGPTITRPLGRLYQSERTNISEAPWHIVEGNDKRWARLNCIDHLLQQIPYTDVPHEEITIPNRLFNLDYERKVLPPELHVPSKYR
ncbi:hypothetical protein QO004_001439 [Rhizobium mesoamericanum]|nr:hypothetical protein [Rhizobium mesoamericanum]